MTTLKDNFFRVIDYLRVSVTDRCNLRCVYCMPPAGVQPFNHGDILSYEEIIRIVGLLRLSIEVKPKEHNLNGKGTERAAIPQQQGKRPMSRIGG